MKGIVIQFRRGKHTLTEKHYLIAIEGVSKRDETKPLIGKTISWKSPAGKLIKGVLAAPHGNKGIVRAIFEKGLPGQAMTTEVSIE